MRSQPSRVYVALHLYTVTSDGGIVSWLDSKAGNAVWQERVGGSRSASPVYADGRIYLLSEAGETTVIEAGPEFKVLTRNPVGEKCQASMAVSGSHLFIRSEKNLFCIGSGR